MNGAQHPGRQVSTIGVLSPVTLRARIAATLLALALVAAAALLARALPGDERGGGADGDLRVRVLSHGEEELAPAPDEPAGWPFPLPLAIEFFTDEFGPPPARWPVEALPVEFCTFQNNRPSSISAAQFRAAVAAAASAWNQAEAAVGVRYRGDCLSGFRWELDNERNEIGFDDSRNEITGTQAGVAIGGWFDIPTSANPERREFSEFDIVLDKRDFPEVPIVCFESTVTHEMGHALGFGHSDSAGDLMVPETDVSDPANCLTAPSAAERARLQELYGVDRAPTVSAGADRIVDPEAAVTLEASGSDPEGEALTFEWVQRSGPAVELSADGASVSFIAPAADEETLVFEVTAVDPLLHPATATVSVTVEDSERAPEEAPGLASFLPGPSGSAEIGWTGVSRTTRYEFCSHPPQLPALAVCRSSSTPFGASDWDLTLGSQGPETATRVFSGAHGGARVTSLRGCNSKGCSPEGVGPLAGGLRWPAWGMDFDYFAIALDFGTLRFTIAGVVNVSGPSRIFTITTGPVEEPDRELIRKCGPVLAGLRCIGFTGFGRQAFRGGEHRQHGLGHPDHGAPDHGSRAHLDAGADGNSASGRSRGRDDDPDGPFRARDDRQRHQERNAHRWTRRGDSPTQQLDVVLVPGQHPGRSQFRIDDVRPGERRWCGPARRLRSVPEP